MCELVCQHALHLIGRQVLQQALGDRDGGVLRISPGRECVWLLGLDQEEPRRGHLRALGQVLNHRLELGQRAGLDRLGAACPECELVGEPVAGDVHQHCQGNEDVKEAPADQKADRDQQAGQSRDQEPRAGLGSEASRCDVHCAQSLLSTERRLTVSRRSLPPMWAGVPGLVDLSRTDGRHPFGDTAPRHRR